MSTMYSVLLLSLLLAGIRVAAPSEATVNPRCAAPDSSVEDFVIVVGQVQVPLNKCSAWLTLKTDVMHQTPPPVRAPSAWRYGTQ
jgi:hypothetical protein